MITVNELNSLWERAGLWDRDSVENGGSGFDIRETLLPVDRDTSIDPEKTAFGRSRPIGQTRYGRQTEKWKKLFRLLHALPSEFNVRSILVTAMSVGADIRDGAFLAKQMNVYERHPELRFYGHDISPLFTSIAATGFIPKAATSHVGNRESYFRDAEEPYEEYVRAREEIEDRITYLKPCCITELKGRFDIALCNVMNPVVKELEDALSERARYLALADGGPCAISSAWRKHCLSQGYEYKRWFTPRLPGEKTPRDIPEALILN